MVQKNHNKGKGKTKSNKPNKTTNFKKKKNKAELIRTVLIKWIAVTERAMSTQ
jgi:hypothetical protein